MGEYRRDVGRYLRGETESYPLLPLDYFEEETERSLQDIEAKARVSRQEKLLDEVSAVLNSARIQNSWRSTAVLIYRNWLEHLCTQKRRPANFCLARELRRIPLHSSEKQANSTERCSEDLRFWVSTALR